ncbi:MAG: ZIP family metal transporter [Flavobacteriales bacterium]|nr:ZIP family metal transporter [Flavobacteriales bacterium]
MEIANIIYLFLSVAIGAIIVEVFKPTKSKNIQLLLTFSGAYLLAVSVMHLIPELFNNNPSNNIGIFILGGFLIQILLEYFSKGIEHGHFHKQKVIPITVMISLCIHALLEGIPLGGGLEHNHSAHNALLTGILLHKAPVSIVLFSLFLQSGMSRIRAYFFLFIFAIMAPLGVYSGHLFSQLALYANEIMAIVIGIFLHISTTILFESTEGHKFSTIKIFAIITGSLLAIFSL